MSYGAKPSKARRVVLAEAETRDDGAGRGAAGYSRDAVRQAKHKIGATAVKRGMLGGRAWRLAESANRRPVEDREGREDGGLTESPSSADHRYLGPSIGEVVEL